MARWSCERRVYLVVHDGPQTHDAHVNVIRGVPKVELGVRGLHAGDALLFVGERGCATHHWLPALQRRTLVPRAIEETIVRAGRVHLLIPGQCPTDIFYWSVKSLLELSLFHSKQNPDLCSLLDYWWGKGKKCFSLRFKIFWCINYMGTCKYFS